MICYDVTYRKSFENLTTWIQEVDRYAHAKALKCDCFPLSSYCHL